MSIARRWQERRERIAKEEAGETVDAPRHAAIGAHEPSETPASDGALPSDPQIAEQLVANRADAEAVDLDALGPGADMSAFLREGVPAALRRQAFRALWRSSPVFGDFERLNDYDEDFRNPKMVMATFQSAWQAGRGYLEAKPESEGEVADGVDDPPAGVPTEPDDMADEAPMPVGEPTPPTIDTPTQLVDTAASLPAGDHPESHVRPAVPSLRDRLGV